MKYKQGKCSFPLLCFDQEENGLSSICENLSMRTIRHEERYRDTDHLQNKEQSKQNKH